MTDQNKLAMDFLETCRVRVDAELDRCIERSAASERLQEAMRYSVLGGGKRIRPALCLAAAKAVGQAGDQGLAPACSVELIHAYSLIHDDLPAMDDDELRRGRPTTHIAFDEATAILAGDALQTLAFGLLANNSEGSAEARLAMIQELARASGYLGMVGGQAIDLESVGKTLSLSQLEAMHRHKTGALIEASVRLGALASGRADEAALKALHAYARAIGLAFQVQDDILDVESDTATLGKTQGKDEANHKPTYPALLGLEPAKAYALELRDQALHARRAFDNGAEPLRELARYIVERRH